MLLVSVLGFIARHFILFKVDESPASETPAPKTPQTARDTSTPMSEASDASLEDANVLTHGGQSARSSRRGRKPLDFPDDKTSKIRSLLQQGPDNANDDAR